MPPERRAAHGDALVAGKGRHEDALETGLLSFLRSGAAVSRSVGQSVGQSVGWSVARLVG